MATPTTPRTMKANRSAIEVYTADPDGYADGVLDSLNGGGAAATVRRHLLAEQMLADTRSKLETLDSSNLITGTVSGDVVRCRRVIVVPQLEEDSTMLTRQLDYVEKELTYVFLKTDDGQWHGTGRSAPNNISGEAFVNWIIDQEIDPATFEIVTDWGQA